MKKSYSEFRIANYNYYIRIVWKEAAGIKLLIHGAQFSGINRTWMIDFSLRAQSLKDCAQLFLMIETARSENGFDVALKALETSFYL